MHRLVNIKPASVLSSLFSEAVTECYVIWVTMNEIGRSLIM